MATTSYPLSAVRELPFFSHLVLAARKRPAYYRSVADLGFLAVRANGSVCECFFGPRGGLVRMPDHGKSRDLLLTFPRQIEGDRPKRSPSAVDTQKNFR